jgi:hypothetical protein
MRLAVHGNLLPAAKPDEVHVFRWENVPLQLGQIDIEPMGPWTRRRSQIIAHDATDGTAVEFGFGGDQP